MYKYNEYNFISPCCNSFNYYNGNDVLCSNCGKLIKKIENDEKITIGVKFNANSAENNISGDIITIFNNNAKKFAHDNTCETIYKQCPQCKHTEVKYLRNPQDMLIYVCCKCRTVFNDDNIVLSKM